MRFRYADLSDAEESGGFVVRNEKIQLDRRNSERIYFGHGGMNVAIKGVTLKLTLQANS